MSDGITVHRRIGELAAELGLNPKTIRYYEDIGLLPQPPRTPAGYRLYGDADRERLQFIIKARGIGLTLDEIHQILALRGEGQPPCEHVVALLDQKIASIDAQLSALIDLRQELFTLRTEAADSVRESGAFCAIIEQHAPDLSEKRDRAAVAPVAIRRLRRS